MPTYDEIREVLLKVIEEEHQSQSSTSTPLQQGAILLATAAKLEIDHDRDLEEALLTQWYDLFRTGYLMWGINLANPNPPFFHLTSRGRHALEKLSRDPGNPGGYLRYLYSETELNPVAKSYLEEGLRCYVNELYKAAAVMIGAGAESIVLGLRDIIVSKLKNLGHPVPKKLLDWKVKTIFDAIQSFMETKKANFPHDLREEFEAYWAAFAQQIRAARNDAGHPSSVDPVTPDTVHASLLIFPEIGKLAKKLSDWVQNNQL